MALAGLQCAASRRGHVSLGLWRVGVHLAVVMSVAIVLPYVPPARRMPREEVAPDAPVCARALAGCGCVHVQTDASHDCLALFGLPAQQRCS